jgi:FkbM family methyltransferase
MSELSNKLKEQPKVSYAQNFEDIVLDRLFEDVKRGFYIDVGANHPSVDSVTKLFYDKGWNGINIEPHPVMYEKLVEVRKRDLNLNLAISDESEKKVFYFFESSGFSTLNSEIAKQHSEGGLARTSSEILTCTLNEVIENNTKNQIIHFLKIDVEGSEREVLLGLNLSKYRPIVILIESFRPNTQIENHTDWESILLDSEYLFCYQDGVNRFYLDTQFSNLQDKFKFPPNVFDHFEKEYPHKTDYIVRLQQKINELNINVDEQQIKIDDLLSRLERVNQTIVPLYGNVSSCTSEKSKLEKPMIATLEVDD